MNNQEKQLHDAFVETLEAEGRSDLANLLHESVLTIREDSDYNPDGLVLAIPPKSLPPLNDNIHIIENTLRFIALNNIIDEGNISNLQIKFRVKTKDEDVEIEDIPF